jgi:diguanylate cyclase (GGDEF)-like protein/PAS domain S-box-containing protein
MGSLENKIEKVSSLIDQYKSINSPKGSVLEMYSKRENLSLFDGNFREILKKVKFSIQPKSINELDFSCIFDKCNDSLIEISREGKILEANNKIAFLAGYTRDELVGNSFYSYLKPEYVPVFEHLFAPFKIRNLTHSTDSANNSILFQCCHKDGRSIAVEGHFEAYKRYSTTIFGVALREITLKNDLQNQLERSQNYYDALSETVNEVILRINKDFTIVYANSAIKSIFGYNPNEVIGENFNILFPPEILKRHEDELKKCFYINGQERLKMGMKNSIEILGLHKNRGISPMEISFGNTKDFEGRALTCIIRDISTRKNAERKLHRLAYFDKLTDLGNRDLFALDMKDHLSNLKLEFTLGSLMFLDLDGFKNINDTLGHNAGDLLLKESAKRLHDCLRESDSVYRLGGDEFLVLLRKIREKNDAAIVAGNILNTLRMPYYLKIDKRASSIVNVGVSIGITLISDAEADVDNLTKEADLAMYASKNSGKNRYTFYIDEMVKEINERWDLEQGLKMALNNNEFEVYYQPIVNCRGEIKGVEALLRWKHPFLGYISPGKFIPIAEETNMIIPIGAWVLEKSCIDITSWNKEGFNNLYVSVNVSAKQFEQTEIVDQLKNVITRTGCSPENLKLEITETAIMQAPDKTIKKMENIKKTFPAIEIMVDDFGTGYSSLNYLANFPADVLKIDLSFVSKLNDPNNRKVVNSIINLAESLEMDCIAEGIETQEEWDYFKKKKCDRLQGYFFSKPLPKIQITKLLKKGKLP